MPGAAGEKGEGGDVGLAGLEGGTGERGAKGPVGNPGSQGATGETVTGADGDDAKDGTPGSKGGPGIQGPYGPEGPTGVDGGQGEPGEPGAEGPVGDDGDTGRPGDQGETGATGDKGEPGEPGLGGLPGEDNTVKGQRGDKGHQGPPGKNVTKPEVPKDVPLDDPFVIEILTFFEEYKEILGLDKLKGEPGHTGPFGNAGPQGEPGEPGVDGNDGEDGVDGPPGWPGPSGNKGVTGATGPQGEQGAEGWPGVPGDDGKPGASGDEGEDGDDGDDGEYGEVGEPGDKGLQGEDGQCGCEKRETGCKSCDVHIVTRHSQTTEEPECPAGYATLWSGYSLVYLEGNGYSLAQDLGSAGSCLEQFQTVPMMQCSGGKVCNHGVRTDKSFWLSSDQNPDISVKPESNLDNIVNFISRCKVCTGSSKIVARHSFTSELPTCPTGFHSLWHGYSYLMVTSSGSSGGGQTLSSAGSCLEEFYIPTFIECLGRGTCSFYINNIDYWLAQNPETTQPGMWGMGNVYSGLDDILDQGVARCTVCAKDVRMKHINYFSN